MKVKVELDPQVVNFIRSAGPDPRKRLRQALRDLEHEKGISSIWKLNWRDTRGYALAIIAL
jgi:hypothetical protein